MKKFFLAALLMSFAGICAFAAQDETGDYESLLVTIWEDSPESQATMATYGVKLGILGCGGAPVYGVESAVITAGSGDVVGFKGALGYTTGKNIKGVLLAPVNLVEKISGLALGVVNVAKEGGLQIGILNFMDNGFLPIFPVFNFAL